MNQVSTNANLDRVGRQHGLDGVVCHNPSQGLTVPVGVMTATLEAIIGAIYLDSGKDIASVQSVMATLGLAPT